MHSSGEGKDKYVLASTALSITDIGFRTLHRSASARASTHPAYTAAMRTASLGQSAAVTRN
jgi:hypothetical protein